MTQSRSVRDQVRVLQDAVTQDTVDDATQTDAIALNTSARTTLVATNVAPTTTVGAKLVMLEGTNNGAHTMTLLCPNSVASDKTITLSDINLTFDQDVASGSAVTFGTVIHGITSQFRAETAGVTGAIVLAELTGGGTNKITMAAPNSLASDRTITLPDADLDLSTVIAGVAVAAVAGTGAQLVLAEPTGGGSSTHIMECPALTGDRTITLGDANVDLTHIAVNTTHKGSTGADHSWLDQSVVNGSTPVFAVTNFTGSAAGIDSSATSHAAANGSSHSYLNQDVTTSATPTFGNTTFGITTTVRAETAGVTGAIVLAEKTGTGTNTVTIAAPAALGGDRTITLPDASVDLSYLNQDVTAGSSPSFGTTTFGTTSQFREEASGTAGAIILAEDSDNGTDKFTMAAPATMGGDRTITLPDADVNLTKVNMLTAADASGAATLILAEDTDNGAHTITIKPPEAVTASAVFRLPNAAMTIGDYLTNINSTNASALTVKSGCITVTTGGAETRTLAIPDCIGQDLTLTAGATMTGACVITVASDIDEVGNNIITLTNIGDSVRLIGCNDGGTLRWVFAGGGLAAGPYSLLS